MTFKKSTYSITKMAAAHPPKKRDHHLPQLAAIFFLHAHQVAHQVAVVAHRRHKEGGRAAHAGGRAGGMKEGASVLAHEQDRPQLVVRQLGEEEGLVQGHAHRLVGLDLARQRVKGQHKVGGSARGQCQLRRPGYKAVFWIRIRSDPKSIAGSGSVIINFGSGSYELQCLVTKIA